MKIRRVLPIILASVTFALAGCHKLESLFGKDVITFTSSFSGLSTRTSYSDDTIDDMYRINWLVGDQMSIGAEQALEVNKIDYVIASTYNEGYISYGTLDVAGDAGLRWGDNGTYEFYAAYPAGLENLSPTGLARWRLPETQVQSDASGWNSDNTSFIAKENGAYMLMAAKCEVKKTASNPSPKVELPFKFLPTVLEFELSGVDNMTINEVKITSSTVKLTGLLDCKIYQEDAEGYPKWLFINSPGDHDVPSKIAKMCPTDNGNPVYLAAGKTLKFHLFLAPTEVTDLTFSINFDSGSGSRTLSTELKKLNEDKTQYEFLTFTAHKKHIIKGLVVPGGVSILIGEDVIMCPWTEENVDLDVE